jgi:hypothetical protein
MGHGLDDCSQLYVFGDRIDVELSFEDLLRVLVELKGTEILSNKAVDKWGARCLVEVLFAVLDKGFEYSLPFDQC